MTHYGHTPQRLTIELSETEAHHIAVILRKWVKDADGKPEFGSRFVSEIADMAQDFSDALHAQYLADHGVGDAKAPR